MVSFEQIKNQAAAQKEEKKQIAEEEARSFAEIKKQEEEKKKEEERKKAEEKANRLKALQDKYDKTEDVKEKVEKRREEIKDEKLEVAKKRSAISSAVKDLISQVRESYDEVKEDPNSILSDFFLKDKDGNITKNLNKEKIKELKEIQDQLPGLEKTKEDRSFLKSQEKKYEKVSSDLEKQKEELYPETEKGLKEKEEKEQAEKLKMKQEEGKKKVLEAKKELEDLSQKHLEKLEAEYKNILEKVENYGSDIEGKEDFGNRESEIVRQLYKLSDTSNYFDEINSRDEDVREFFKRFDSLDRELTKGMDWSEVSKLGFDYGLKDKYKEKLNLFRTKKDLLWDKKNNRVDNIQKLIYSWEKENMDYDRKNKIQKLFGKKPKTEAELYEEIRNKVKNKEI